MTHYSDVILALRYFILPATRLFVQKLNQANNKDITALNTDPLCGESRGDQLIPYTKGQRWEIVSISLHHFDGLMQERRNSIANALELRLSYTNPLILWLLFHKNSMLTQLSNES